MSVRKQALKGKDEELRHEQQLLSQLKHRNIVKTSKPSLLRRLMVSDQSEMYMENGGATLKTLKNLIPQRTALPTTEQKVKEAKQHMGQVVDALVYLQGKGVIHFDLKPDNILLNPVTGRILLADFGLARKTYSQGKIYAAGGTQGYMAPEVVLSFLDKNAPPVSTAADAYSLGCILFEMITGSKYLPTFGQTEEAQYASLYERSYSEYSEPLIRAKIQHAMPGIPPAQIDETVNLLMGMLNPDPQNRIGPREIARHPFFSGFCQPLQAPQKPGILKQIKGWLGYK
ncbi:serine/threonine-protein kinase [Sansalvadorimonas sp. 2012CJ34-2]|uniref:Serine/threonine-protein kinase n=1 Tax=Parendozoicomonas callyspongiae TaxID=2942213 RepID=A0ABT0PCR1_9GAMM|nr:serine/threonine-protein kinase [Sansalvadorimonas sp. 2012CJ34-2]